MHFTALIVTLNGAVEGWSEVFPALVRLFDAVRFLLGKSYRLKGIGKQGGER